MSRRCETLDLAMINRFNIKQSAGAIEALYAPEMSIEVAERWARIVRLLLIPPIAIGASFVLDAIPATKNWDTIWLLLVAIGAIALATWNMHLGITTTQRYFEVDRSVARDVFLSVRRGPDAFRETYRKFGLKPGE